MPIRLLLVLLLASNAMADSSSMTGSSSRKAGSMVKFEQTRKTMTSSSRPKLESGTSTKIAASSSSSASQKYSSASASQKYNKSSSTKATSPPTSTKVSYNSATSYASQKSATKYSQSEKMSATKYSQSEKMQMSKLSASASVSGSSSGSRSDRKSVKNMKRSMSRSQRMSRISSSMLDTLPPYFSSEDQTLPTDAPFVPTIMPAPTPSPTEESTTLPEETPDATVTPTSLPTKPPIATTVSPTTPRPTVAPAPDTPEPTTPLPITSPPTTLQPTTLQPTTPEPTTQPPTTLPPTTPRPTTLPPTTPQPTALPPTTPQPTTPQPTTLSPTTAPPTPLPTAAPTESNYKIDLSFADNVPPTLRENIAKAATRIESIIVGDLPVQNNVRIPDDYECADRPTSVDDMWICAQVGELPEFVEGQGGFNEVRFNYNYLPSVGYIKLSNTVQDFPEATLIHEMMHAIGFGTLWEITGLRSTASESSPCMYSSTSDASAEYQALSGCPTQDSIPITSECLHWNEACFGDELMTPTLSTNMDGSVPFFISRLTVASLADLGYEVNYDAADEYTRNNMDASCLCNPGRHVSKPPPPPMTEELRRKAIDYGKKVLKQKGKQRERLLKKRPLHKDEEKEAGVKFVGDQIVFLMLRENGQRYSLVVTPSS